MKNLIYIFLGITLTSCSGVCLNPDCEFPELKPPIILTNKSFEQVTCVDSEGTIWTSPTGWNIAKGIMLEGHSVGDTIIH